MKAVKSKPDLNSTKKTISGKTPAKKVKPWDAIVQNPLAPGKVKKASQVTMKKEILGWEPHHSQFWR
jgi:hypothetical protein